MSRPVGFKQIYQIDVGFSVPVPYRPVKAHIAYHPLIATAYVPNFPKKSGGWGKAAAFAALSICYSYAPSVPTLQPSICVLTAVEPSA